MKGLLLALLLAGPAEALTWSKDLGAALKAADARGALVLVDLYGEGCVPCERMDKAVLNTSGMERFQERLELVKLCADTPEGAAFKKRHRILGIPTYMVVDAKGEEVGMLLGELSPEDFFARLDAIVSRRISLKDSERRAKKGQATLAEVRSVLSAHAQRRADKEGLGWFAKLPASMRRQAERDAEAGSDLQRLRLYAARNAQKGGRCAAPAERLLELNQGSLGAYDLFLIRSCSSYQPEEARRKAFEILRAPLEKLLAEQRALAPASRKSDLGILQVEAEELYRTCGPPEKLEELRKSLNP